MANNLSSNQQYLLSMIQQNNPEILSKFLNEDAPQPGPGRKNQPAPSPAPSAPKQDIVYYDPTESQKREISRQDKASKHYNEVIGSLPSDPSKLSAKQAAEVAMYKIMSKSGPGSEKLKADVEDVNSENTKKLSSMSDAALRSRSVTTGENTSPSTQSKVALRYQKKAEENALPFEDRPISPFYKTTRNQFKDQFKRDYNPLSKEDSSALTGMANAPSETLRQNILTIDAFNRGYKEISDNMAARMGSAERALDTSRREYDRFKNDPQYREKIRRDAMDTVNIADVAKQMANDLNLTGKSVNQKIGRIGVI
jgi:hypothetical protein